MRSSDDHSSPVERTAGGPNRAGHFPGLDGLRGAACLLVFCYHLAWVAGDPPLALAGFSTLPLFKNADLGVAIFFGLSGQLLSLPYWRWIMDGGLRPDAVHFLWRRCCRLVPAYYLCLAVVYLLREDAYTFFGALDFLLHVAFLHPFSQESYTSVNGVLWTIGIEMQFYLLLPVIMLAMRAAWMRSGPWIAGGLLLAGTWLIHAGVSTLLVRLAADVPDRFLLAGGHVPEGTIFSYLRFFAFGILAGALTMHWRRSPQPRLATWAGGIGLAGLAALLWLSQEGLWHRTAWAAWPLNMICVGLLTAGATGSRVVSKLCAWPPLVFAGEISYAFYLWHYLVLKAVFGGTLPGRLEGWPLFLTGGGIAMAVTGLLAWLSYRHLEKPALDSTYPFVGLALKKSGPLTPGAPR